MDSGIELTQPAIPSVFHLAFSPSVDGQEPFGLPAHSFGEQTA